MSTTEDHYAHFLAPIYSWMLGGIEAATDRARQELEMLEADTATTRTAVDLGAGAGAHSVALAERGFSVVSIDSCEGLLSEIRTYSALLDIRTIHGDIRSFRKHVTIPPGIILCMGDTLTHLPSMSDVETLFRDIRQCLDPDGLFFATFRDYTGGTTPGEGRFVSVRSDADRILTCLIEPRPQCVRIHDLLHTRNQSEWTFSTSSYRKLRVDPRWVTELLTGLGFDVKLGQTNRMTCIRARLEG